MSEQTTVGPAPKRAMEDQTYTVQVQKVLVSAVDTTGSEDVEVTAWVDVATVTVPARTLRKTVVEKALAEAEITPEVGTQMHVRVLDAQSAAPFSVGAVQPPPVLEIGEPV